MTRFQSLVTSFYNTFILQWPRTVIVCLLLIVAFLGYKARDFTLDASAETLVLENDEALRYARQISARYGIEDFLLLAYTPKAELFSPKVLADLKGLRDELLQLENVASVVSILDVPLFESKPGSVKELINNIQTLESADLDRNLVRQEFLHSPLYQDLLVSPDLKTTALQIIFAPDNTYTELQHHRNLLRYKQADSGLTGAEAAEFQEVSRQFREYRDRIRQNRHRNIVAVRGIMNKYRQDADLFLGGVSMIADDLISFIRNDLKIFGLGVLCFLIITLGIIFRSVRWIMLPLFCCVLSVVSMMGFLGLFGWEVTVISSNFISLQLIITMSITIHLTVRYRELLFYNPRTEHRELVLETVRFKLTPCLYAVLTTIAGFGSLLLCDILPVINFGWMMSAGIAVSLLFTFLFFPAALLLLGKSEPPANIHPRLAVTTFLADFTAAHGRKFFVVSAAVLLISGVGISRLVVENSFIDYFKKSTEIYQGMKVIDQNLGGTTPLDVVVDLAPEAASSIPDPAPESTVAGGDDFAMFDEFEDAEKEGKYWFTAEKMAFIEKIHQYLDGRPETGKVLSLATMLQIARRLNNGKPLDNFELALVYEKLPQKYKDIVLAPYVSMENNQIRFAVRVMDSEKSLQRGRLLQEIRQDLVGKLDLEPGQVRLTGMLVLYNNMLQSLFRSQILTLGVVVLALMGMFLLLFRSLKVSLIAIFPNLLSIGIVLGAMGWFGIPLDMMTITIAAISVGIAVDDTIHFLDRFEHEFVVDRNYLETMYRCHSSIGHAMYYTSVTIIVGFSILMLSNFIPTIYFGLLTGLAMLVALLASLTLLPQLIIAFKPFGPEAGPRH